MFSIAVSRIEFDYNGFCSLVLFLSFFLPAYFSMCETYFLKALHLPLLNGPNEGIVGPMIACIVSYFTGKCDDNIII